MSVRLASLFAASAVALIAVPAAAQDGRYASLPPLAVESYDEEWEPLPVEYREDDYARDYREDYPGDYRSERYQARPQGRPLGYSMAERDAWLADCRALYLGDSYFADGYYEEDRDDGGIIGGLLGAVVGGIAGNRIADGERLGGTLIGAGLGGLAGLAIGSAIDALGDDRDEWEFERMAREETIAAEYCEAYLRRYESGGYAGAHGGEYGYAVQAQPVMVVRVIEPAYIERPRRRYREIVREEWVDVPVDAPVAEEMEGAAPLEPVPEPEGSKLQPVR